jgi:hypothetical protein
MIATLVVAVFVAPVAAFAAAPSGEAATSAKADCTALQAKMGATAFTQAYSSFGSCVSRFASVEQQTIASAQATCTAQQAATDFAATHGGKTFDQFYGTGKKANNAFDNCVRAVAKASSQTERQNRLNPAGTCRASRTSMGTALFNSTFGKNANDKNAFGKCVSKTASSQSHNETAASASCKSQQDADEAGFDQKFTNFGSCVSTTANQTSTTQQQATIAAAKQCASQLKSNATAFHSKFHTFGACVSQTTHE